MSFLGFLHFISQDFGHFFGFMMVLTTSYTFLFKLITSLWNRLMTAITIWKNGYPPEHTDVMGDTFNGDLRVDDLEETE